MAAQFGAHEIMELHEVLTDAIDGINQFELYRPHVQDQQLGAMIDRQINFMTQEYNTMVQALNQKGANPGVQYRPQGSAEPVYGLRNPQPQSPMFDVNRLSDREVASGMLGFHKASAICKTMATLECADPQLRRLVQTGISNCCEMAYETWQYMNQHKYYQVPTLAAQTTDTMIHSYQPAPMQGMQGLQGMPGMQQGMQEMQGMQQGMPGMQATQGMHGYSSSQYQ